MTNAASTMANFGPDRPAFPLRPISVDLRLTCSELRPILTATEPAAAVASGAPPVAIGEATVAGAQAPWVVDMDRLLAAGTVTVRRCVALLSGYKRPTLVVVESGPLPRTLKGSVRHDEVARMIGNRRASEHS